MTLICIEQLARLMRREVRRGKATVGDVPFFYKFLKITYGESAADLFEATFHAADVPS